MQRPPEQLLDLIRDAETITFFTGAGMSAESGVPTFRDALTGLWERFDPAQLDSIEAFQRNPALVWGWYQWRAHLVRQAQPNRGHDVISELSASKRINVVTQNVDDLHERSGSSSVIHLHGSLYSPRCSHCGAPYRGTDAEPPTTTPTSLEIEPPMCPGCLSDVRPGVVFFGEGLPTDEWDRATIEMTDTDLVIVVGTSGVVYPAAGLPLGSLSAGLPVVEINPLPSQSSERFTLCWQEKAGTGLEALAHSLVS